MKKPAYTIHCERAARYYGLNPLFGLGLAISLLTLMGCQPTEVSTLNQTGTGKFLQDYSKLESISPKSWRYVNPAYNLGDYNHFIVDRVTLLLDEETEKNIGSWNELEGLRAYLRNAVIHALNV